jgi:hypothetical protein
MHKNAYTSDEFSLLGYNAVHFGVVKHPLFAACFIMVSRLAYSLTLKMALCSSEISVDLQRTT